MIRLKDIIAESFVPENRISLTKVSVIMEKLMVDLNEADAKSLVELYTQLNVMVTELNSTPYTKFNMDGWAIAVLAAKQKIGELKETAMKIAESKNSVDCSTLIKALDEVIL